jgi:hypothetical protein
MTARVSIVADVPRRLDVVPGNGFRGRNAPSRVLKMQGKWLSGFGCDLRTDPENPVLPLKF